MPLHIRFKKIFDAWAWGGSRSSFARYRKEITKVNVRTARGLSVAALALFLLYIPLYSIFLPEKNFGSSYFLFALILSASVYISVRMEHKEQAVWYDAVLLALISACLAYAVYHGTVESSGDSGIILPVMIVVVLSLFLFPPYLMALVASAAAAAGIALGFMLKPETVALSCAFRIFGALFFGLFTNFYKTRWRLGAIRSGARIRVLNKRLKKLSHTDMLTGLGNRLAFSNEYDAVFAEHKQHGVPFGIIMFDVDYFKNYNDTYGHLEGDKCLKLAADTLKKAAGADGRIFRLGGEEFIVLCESSSKADIMTLAERMRESVEGLTLPNAGAPCGGFVTISAGACIVAKPHSDGVNGLCFVNKADEALYKSKADGRNIVTMS